MRCVGIPAYGVQRANFHQKMKMMNLQYFCIFMYIWWLLKFVGVFFCGKLTKPCRHARTFQLVSQQSLASINNKNAKFKKKRLPVATTVPSRTQRYHWGIGISGYTFGSSMQDKIPKILTKRPPVATTVPQAPSVISGVLVYRGISSDLQSRPEQSHHLHGALLPQWLQAVYRVSNGRSHL